MLTTPDKVKLFTLMGSYPNAMALKDGQITSETWSNSISPT